MARTAGQRTGRIVWLVSVAAAAFAGGIAVPVALAQGGNDSPRDGVGSPWEQTPADYCDSLPAEVASEQLSVFDHATRGTVKITALELCQQSAALSANGDPGDVVPVFTVRDGKVTAEYHRVERQFVDGEFGREEHAVITPEVVPPDQVPGLATP